MLGCVNGALQRAAEYGCQSLLTVPNEEACWSQKVCSSLSSCEPAVPNIEACNALGGRQRENHGKACAASAHTEQAGFAAVRLSSLQGSPLMPEPNLRADPAAAAR